MYYFWVSCWFSFSACRLLLRRWTCQGQECVLVCVCVCACTLSACACASVCSSSGCFLKFMVDDELAMFGPGKAGASCCINNGSTAGCIYSNSGRGPWCMRYSTSCQLAGRQMCSQWNPRTSSGHEFTCKAAHTSLALISAERCFIRGEKVVELLSLSYRLRMRERQAERMVRGKGDIAYRIRLMWSHIDWPT